MDYDHSDSWTATSRSPSSLMSISRRLAVQPSRLIPDGSSSDWNWRPHPQFADAKAPYIIPRTTAASSYSGVPVFAASSNSWSTPSIQDSNPRLDDLAQHEFWRHTVPTARINMYTKEGSTLETSSIARANPIPDADELRGGLIPPRKLSSQRAGSNRDEFDGPHQLLERPNMHGPEPSEKDLICLPTNLSIQEQDHILTEVNTRLSYCAFKFIAMYQFPIPIEPSKRRVASPADREWNEWVFLLKRLATKRRIPARVLYNSDIRQLNTILDNSLEMRHVAMHRSRPIKDDRNVLQLISAGTQVAKILKDALTMQLLDKLYVDTERLINSRK